MDVFWAKEFLCDSKNARNIYLHDYFVRDESKTDDDFFDFIGLRQAIESSSLRIGHTELIPSSYLGLYDTLSDKVNTMFTNYAQFLVLEVNGVRACAGPACVSQPVQRPCTRTAIKAVRPASTLCLGLC